MKLQAQTIRTLRRVSFTVVGGVATLWCLAGIAATDAASSTASSTAAAPSKTSIIIVGGRSAMRSPLNPQPLPPRW